MKEQMKEQVYVVRGPKGRANMFLTGTETHQGEWGPRATALRGDLAWAEQTARLCGGRVDFAGWREVPQGLLYVSPDDESRRRSEEAEAGAAERAARKDGTFFGSWG